MRMPWFLRLPMIDWARPRFSNNELSVISTSSRSAEKPVSTSSFSNFWASQGSFSCEGEMLTDRVSCGSQPCFFEGLTHHRHGKIADQAAFLGDADELVGQDDASLRMLPAREHLETVEAAADKVDLLLEIWEELAVGNAAAEARFDGVAALQFPLHAAVEPDIATAAQQIGRAHV